MNNPCSEIRSAELLRHPWTIRVDNKNAPAHITLPSGDKCLLMFEMNQDYRYLFAGWTSESVRDVGLTLGQNVWLVAHGAFPRLVADVREPANPDVALLVMLDVSVIRTDDGLIFWRHAGIPEAAIAVAIEKSEQHQSGRSNQTTSHWLGLS